MPDSAPAHVSAGSLFLLQAENNLWSNHRLYAAASGLPPHALGAKRPCFFGSIRNTFEHLLLVQRRYLARIAGEPVPEALGAAEVDGDLAALAEFQLAEDRALVALVEGLAPERLGAPVGIVDEAGALSHDPLHRVLAHLFVHQVHHRGQIHDMLSQTSVAPPQLDEFFLSQDAPRRAAEMARLGLTERR